MNQKVSFLKVSKIFRLVDILVKLIYACIFSRNRFIYRNCEVILPKLQKYFQAISQTFKE